MKKYINSFLSLNAALDLLPFFMVGQKYSAKEVTESYAMLWAAKHVLHADAKEPYVAIVVGDGSKPRTAALLSHLTQWYCYAIDPNLNEGWWQRQQEERAGGQAPLKRLWALKQKAEEAIVGCNKRKTIIFMPHSHAHEKPALSVARNAESVDLISMPCCVRPDESFIEKDFALRTNMQVYKDKDVWSPHNTVYIWRGLGTLAQQLNFEK